jgi:hypothetical protein
MVKNYFFCQDHDEEYCHYCICDCRDMNIRIEDEMADFVEDFDLMMRCKHVNGNLY